MKSTFILKSRVITAFFLIIILSVTAIACGGGDKDPFDEYKIDDPFEDIDIPAEETPVDSGSLIAGETEVPDDSPAVTPIEIAMTPLTTETLQPSAQDQQVAWKDQVTVTMPAGTLQTSQKMTISSVDTELPPKNEGFTALSTYDVSLGNLHEFEKPLTIALAYDPAKLGGQPPETSLCVSWWDETRNTWWRTVSQVDSARNVVVIQTKHLTRWRLEMWLWGDEKLNSDHFIVVWNKGDSPTINKAAQDPAKFAATVSGYMESAYKKYYDSAYAVNPATTQEAKDQKTKYKLEPSVGKNWVVIDPSMAESETNTKYGDITLKAKFDSDDDVKQDCAHELFHVVQLNTLGVSKYLKSRWWSEACADYAACNIAWTLNMPLLTESYPN
jgi:hypothetical protein